MRESKFIYISALFNYVFAFMIKLGEFLFFVASLFLENEIKEIGKKHKLSCPGPAQSLYCGRRRWNCAPATGPTPSTLLSLPLMALLLLLPATA